MDICDRLTHLAGFYHMEARRCVRGKAYLAACIMQGAVLEAALHAMCCLYPDDVKKTVVFKGKRFRRTRSKALEFTYNELIKIADELHWFPPKRFNVWGRRTNVVGWAHELRRLRNYVHPAIWAPEKQKSMKFTKGVYGVVYEIFDVANLWLVHRVEESLARKVAHNP